MNSNQKFTYGLIIEICGAFLCAVGLAISFTLIGACLGVPMALVGLPLMIWGAVWLFQARAEKTKEIISVGIQQGLARHELPRIGNGPPPLSTPKVVEQSAIPPPIPVAFAEDAKPFNRNDNAANQEADRNDEPEQLI
jgi:hypothetical protein